MAPVHAAVVNTLQEKHCNLFVVNDAISSMLTKLYAIATKSRCPAMWMTSALDQQFCHTLHEW